MLYTETSVTRHLTAFCQAHLGRHDSPEYARYQAEFQNFLNLKRAEQSAPHDNGGRFGMSGAAGCLRATALRRAGIKGKPVDGDSAVTFEIGHLLECMASAVLAASGFRLERVQETIRLDPAFQSRWDGVLEAGPVALPYPLVLSIKTASYKSSSPPRGNSPAKRYGFAQLPLDGIRKAQPSWYVQSQLEMAASGFTHSLVVTVAKDMIAAFRGDSVFESSGSLSWYAELLKADKDLFSPEIGPIPIAYANALAVTDPHYVEPAVPILTDEPMKMRWARLPKPGDVESKWGGEHQAATASYNTCYGCPYGGNKEFCK